MNRPKILIISHRLPYPLNSGGKQAIFNGIDAIRQDYDVFVTYSEAIKKPSAEDVQGFMEATKGTVTLVPFVTSSHEPSAKASLGQRIQGKLRRWFSSSAPSSQPNPYSSWINELGPMPLAYQQHVNDVIKRYGIDIVQCEMLCNLAFVHSLPASVKKVFVHHELGFVRHELELKGKSSAEGLAMARRAKELEISQLNGYDCVVTLSPIDRQKLVEAGVTVPVRDSFAIVNPERTIEDVQEPTHRLTFVGPDNHTPNYVGLLWFLENCWTSLLHANPTFHLTVIGRWTERHISELTTRYQNLSFAGFVDDLPSALQGTTMIVPITVGSGIRMKILEAASIGIPFVSTTVGAEGIPVVSGEHCLLADTPDDFVASVLQLCNPLVRQRMIVQAMCMVKTHYSAKALHENRSSIYHSLYEAE